MRPGWKRPTLKGIENRIDGVESFRNNRPGEAQMRVLPWIRRTPRASRGRRTRVSLRFPGHLQDLLRPLPRVREHGKTCEHREPGMDQRTHRQALLWPQNRRIPGGFLLRKPPYAGGGGSSAVPDSLSPGRRLEAVLPHAEDRKRRFLPPGI